ncbi:MAG: SpoIIE family protein phosphatase, partial [Candidatus Marinimicrobia bacterium]|nr:SpoIIE family protein phosphatase [Candidatus Neomarinimicrobiota bacterium]
GMPAALLMSNLQATLRGQTRFSTSSSQCLKRSNKLLYESTDVQKFATLFYGMLNYEKHEFTYSKAGHDPAFFYQKDQGMRRLETGGTILGFREDSEFEEETLQIEIGDLLVVYSDGITEAMNNERDEEFGEERLEEVIMANLELPSRQLIEQIFKDVRAFTKDTPQSDDMTLLVIQRSGT